jgi:PRTRC genetic system protein E
MSESSLTPSVGAFFASVQAAMTDGERLRFEFARKADGQLDLTVIPVLSGDDDDVPEAAKPVRAALAMPLAFRGMSLATLSEGFAARLHGLGAARQTTQAAYDELLQTLRDAEAEAKNQREKKGAGKQAVAPKEPALTPEAEAAPPPPVASLESASALGKGILGF